MNSIFAIIFATAGLIISDYTLAVDMPAEGQTKCGTCHAIDKHNFGPSFMAVSEKYKGIKMPQAKLLLALLSAGRLAGYLDLCRQKA
ncbi:MAG: hypothetical protein DID92_2727744055 [Candidatus Nitrotoga sp. SPKER]|nr:MAG: hypothetical protein DID92_2727744055 [Candidatus Nitrotoga sp. SPKER]